MTNEITLLKALKDGATINPNFQPQNNKQAYLAYLCGLDIALPEPRTAEEILLCNLCVNGDVGGNGSGVRGGNFKLNNAAYLFYKGNRLDQLDELLKAASGANDMSYMFAESTELTSLDFSEFDTSNVTNMEGIFDDCENLTKIVGFSAVGLPEGMEVCFPSDTSGTCVLERLTFRTDLPDGQLAIKGHIDLTGAPMTRLPMIEMFKSLPDVSNTEQQAVIFIYGTGATTGRTVIKAGSHEEIITTPERFEELMELYSLYEVIVYVTLPNGKEQRMGVGDMLLEQVKRGGMLPFHKLRWEDSSTVRCAMLTNEDRAIAINKGWILEE